ncbi:glycosyltransferase [Cryobacterium sp. PH31-L1]|uniref:glycosyltransferase n=1 Tax=Cryobacterium sp. PH31-L1 TaxID=3046199 RepID=UPI0024B954C4|nr:glycosyltransferase [Cryobacterium sp. PH31-L1]MDJ0376968.1 glycosyltransferase [Cryobacterium sp. PH31-L1]
MYPPVEVAHIQEEKDWANRVTAAEQDLLERLPDTFLLGASRFVEYKALDLVIDAGAQVGLPVVLAGSGPLARYLVNRAQNASVPVTIISAPSDQLLYALYQRALAFIFPPVEDFGIMPVEAMAAGCPVIVNRRGGTTESVSTAVSGFKIDNFSGADLTNAISAVASLNRNEIQASVLRFNSQRFRAELKSWIEGQELPTTLAAQEPSHAQLSR